MKGLKKMKNEETMELKTEDLDQVAGGANSSGYTIVLGTVKDSFRDPRPKARVQLDSGEKLTCEIDLKLVNQMAPELPAPGARVELYKLPLRYVVKSVIE